MHTWFLSYMKDKTVAVGLLSSKWYHWASWYWLWQESSRDLVGSLKWDALSQVLLIFHIVDNFQHSAIILWNLTPFVSLNSRTQQDISYQQPQRILDQKEYWIYILPPLCSETFCEWCYVQTCDLTAVFCLFVCYFALFSLWVLILVFYIYFVMCSLCK